MNFHKTAIAFYMFALEILGKIFKTQTLRRKETLTYYMYKRESLHIQSFFTFLKDFTHLHVSF